MRIFTLSIVLFLAFAPPDARGESDGGTVTGHVIAVEGGKPTKRDEVWVYLQLKTSSRDRNHATSPARKIRQEHEQFSPHVLVVPVGTTVWFPNYDREEHNVFSPNDPPGQFDLGRHNTDHKGEFHRFDDPYEMEIYCDIHKDMWARIKVVDTDANLIAKVDADGKFTLAGVPAGTYRLHAWTYASDEVGEDIEVRDGQTLVAPELHLQLGKMKPHLNKDGSPYGPYHP